MYKYLLFITTIYIGTLNTDAFANITNGEEPYSDTSEVGDPAEALIELSPEKSFEELSR